MPFDGLNPNSVVILDNASIHHVHHIVETIECWCTNPLSTTLLTRLEPNRGGVCKSQGLPDLNPIEEAFAKVKVYLKANEAAIQVSNNEDLQDFILAGFASITPDDGHGWFKQSGYL